MRFCQCYRETIGKKISRYFLWTIVGIDDVRSPGGRIYVDDILRDGGMIMVGRDTELIRRYIAEQEMEGRRLDQLEMP